jgi:tetratricopeptide (TPR) repeat protein
MDSDSSWLPTGTESLENFPPLRFSGLIPLGVRRGGMGLVYFCRSEIWLTMPRVAVKRIRPELLQSDKALNLFLHECYLWVALGAHDNIVELSSIHQAPYEPPIIIAEFAGESLRDLLKQRERLDIVSTLRVAADCIEGLRYAGARVSGFIHGDLKPENILISRDRNVARLSDFGLARSQRDLQRDPASWVGVFGTPYYMAPEQTLGHTTAASDVYALGCIMRECLTGSLLFPDVTDPRTYMEHHREVQPTPTETVIELPEPLARLIDSCLKKSVESRPSLTDAQDVLMALLVEQGVRYKQSKRRGRHESDFSSQYNGIAGLLNIGDYENAFALVDEAIPRLTAPGDLALAMYLRGRALGGLKRFAEAAADLSKAEAILSQAPEMKSTLANVYLEQARGLHESDDLASLRRALSLTEKARDLFPDGSAGHASVAYAYRRLGDTANAVESMLRALKIATNVVYYESIIEWTLGAMGYERLMYEVTDDYVANHPERGASYAWRAIARAWCVGAGLSDAIGARVADQYRDLEAAKTAGAPKNLVTMAKEITVSIMQKQS